MALANPAPAIGLINPTLKVLGCFMTEVNGEKHDAHINLADHADLSGWLLSLLDHLLMQRGMLPGPCPIAEPPGGRTRQELIDAGILYLAPRPDGGMQLGINANFSAQLMLDVRRRNARAHNTMLDLADDPDLTRWLLRHFARIPGANDLSRLGSTLVDSLRRHSVLVDELPAPDAYFPDPAEPVEFPSELALAARMFAQPAGQPVPAEVRQILGKHTPALPPGSAIVWTQDAGTGMVFPAFCPHGHIPIEASGFVQGSGAAQRVVQWNREREAARQSVRAQRHAVLRDIVPSVQRAKLRHYVRQLRERGYFPELGDGQVALRASIHNQPTIASLHQGLANIINTINEEQVIPSYCYLSCYEEGSVLDRHLDRQQCAYNLCLVLDYRFTDGRAGEPDPWPIYLELDDKPVPALLNVGDGIFFSGRSIYHWRDALPQGQRAVVCFFHFVPPGFGGSLD